MDFASQMKVKKVNHGGGSVWASYGTWWDVKAGLAIEVQAERLEALIISPGEHPSLSLLQKTPSSPVSCHATGFYPKSALMFWKKDGEEIHEHVEHGEILPNNDGTFQMTVYLNISSISLDDWKRYVCVFKFLDKEEENIQLDEAEIKTNRALFTERQSNTTAPIIAVAISFVLVSIGAAGYVVYKKKIVPEGRLELLEPLNSEA
ncbi:major histocompatibility complex class I-related gene protein-like [Cyprinodon tularosa]|uniref:major histocompatibility complex class I-related gene protein-like n=1 Tax=Cyprinodon tularosa TaxID=77115 RepID=UPI0018E2907E|nr:major histocompatibility complex class I-related gene protein-like [Cyprinodon tularosa]